MTAPTTPGTGVSSTNNTASTSLAVVLPSGIVAGETIVIELALSTPRTVTPPAGFTVLYSASAGALLYKPVAAGTEGGTTVTVTLGPGSASFSAWAYRVAGADTATAPEFATSSGSSAAPQSPSLTPSWGSADVLSISHFTVFPGPGSGSSTLTSSPSGYTQAASGYLKTSAGGAIMATAAEGLTGSTTQTPGAWGISASFGWTAWTTAFKGSTSAATSTNMLLMF